MDHADDDHTDGDESESSPEKIGTKQPRYTPSRRVIALVSVLLAIAIAAQQPLMPDEAVGNIITLIGSFLTLVTLLCWFSFRSAYPRRLRQLVPAGLLLAVAVFFGFYKIDHVTGGLIPVFGLRWQPAPDRLLQSPLEQHSSDKAVCVDMLTTTPDDFPEFLGQGRSGAVEDLRLARDWSSADWQTPLWKQKIGAGWSSFSIVNGFAVTMEQRGSEELVTCYDVLTGELMWSHAIEGRYETKMGGVGPRATPTINDGRVYAAGGTGVLRCLDGATGELIWQRDIVDEIGSSAEEELAAITFGRSNSPLLVGDLLIHAIGGPKEGPYISLMAMDKVTGDEVWRGGKHQVSYASPSLATIGGVEQILTVNQDYLAGHDLKSGTQLWQFDWPGKSGSNASASQAVALPNDRIFISKGYSQGSALLQITHPADAWNAELVWQNYTVMKTKFSNVAIHNGFVYGLDESIMQCIDLGTGKKQWKRGRFGHGQILRVGDLLLVQRESGTIVLIELSSERLIELGQFDALDGKTWSVPSLYGPYLLVRNAEEAACYQLPLAP